MVNPHSDEKYNHDPNARFSNAQLRRHSISHFVFFGLVGAVGAAVSYVYITDHHPVGALSILFGVLGAAAAVALWWPCHFRYARKKKAEFISAGGDPTGITLFMFGSMGGHLTKDGQWEWNYPPGSGGDYV